MFISILNHSTKRQLLLSCDTCKQKFIRNYKKVIQHKQNHFCCVTCYSESRKKGGLIYEAAKLTSNKLYGVDHPMQSLAIKEKLKKSMQVKYGVQHNMQLQSVKEKKQKTLDKKYGGHQMFDQDVKRRVKNTNIVRYGVETPLITADVLRKSHSKSAQDKKYETELARGWHKVSKPELKFLEILKEYYKDVKHGIRHDGFCIDMYITCIDVYVQIDGVYWHGLDRNLVEIEKSAQQGCLRDAAILKKYKRDRRCDEHFRTMGYKLVRMTDKEIELTDNKCLFEIFTARLNECGYNC